MDYLSLQFRIGHGLLRGLLLGLVLNLKRSDVSVPFSNFVLMVYRKVTVTYLRLLIRTASYIARVLEVKAE